MPYDALIERTLSKSRQEVYRALADFGGIGRLVPQIVKSSDLEGQGIGAKRNVELNPDCGFSGSVVERVEVAYDERVFSYSIVGDCPLPMADYVAVVELEDAPGGCKVRYGSNWTPVGIDKSEHKAAMEALYGEILDGIEAS